ncbi:DNA repair protein SMC6 [Spizellomyces punctatus DAOM BR117]|uniref:RecF/RecN/SMC N-terminal domain-containing protein n=1 Tax=Spizellomyces punctatus (strain DAOM BR117) TaxID=645134 RepID=A0A0L0HP63_SPIPD|nr:DNA repair protein SMC6 [Spizellomyces punctatus DAOM BR117]KND02887.1 hypothetical protein SPPG_01968 [Spizellomyces punctatus DAOM BR117]|eukprot:XP_016610926.1 hypothetical protein SPPG_01968 [Spizellomyces punctatus DAOM BR117]
MVDMEDDDPPSSVPEAPSSPLYSNSGRTSAGKKRRPSVNDSGSRKKRRSHVDYDSASSNSDTESVIEEIFTKNGARELDGTGTVARVELVNFMCHKYLAVSFGRKINFIVGHNGSGKSAILTALAICLGGRATFTNRAGSLKEFLREGSQVGSVSVTLRNEGEDAYKPHEYGNTITIERKILREGSSTYRLKSAQGATISTKRDELVAICDHMQILANNPMTILTQDSARSFLANSTSVDKYNFFMNGTQLNQLSADYYMINESVSTIENVLQHKRQVLPEMKSSVKDLETTLKNLEQAKDLEEHVEHLKKQMAWAQIAEEEQEVEAKRKAAEKAQRKVDLVHTKISDCENALSDIGKEIDNLETQIAHQKQATQPLHEQKQQIVQEIMALRQRLMDFATEEQEMNTTVKTHRRNRDDFRRRIAEETKKTENDSRTTRKQQLTLISERETEKAVLEEKLRQLQLERDRVETAHGEATDRLREAQGRLRRFDADIRSCQERISGLSRQRTDRLAAFGPTMGNVVRMVEEYEQQGRWTGRKPIGPLGLHVKVLQDDFARVIESLLGNTLNSMAVENQEDLLTMQSILDRCRCPSNILKYSRRPIHFKNGEPDTQYLTVLRALEFDNDVVRDQLILQHHIEQMVLVQTRDEGNAITGKSFPRNVSGVFTIDCFSMGSRGGGLSTQSIVPYRGQPRLAADVSIFIRQEEAQINQLREEKAAWKPTVDQLEDQVAAVSQQRQRLRAEQVALHSDVGKKETEIRQMREDLVDDEESNIGALQEACKYEEDQIELILRQFEALEGQRREVQTAEASLKAQLATLEDERQIMVERHTALTNRVREAADKKVKYENDRTHWENQRIQYQEKLRQAQEELNVAEEQLAVDTEKCEQYCERVPVDKPADEIERDIRLCQARLKEIEKKHGSRDDVYHAYVTKKAAYAAAKREIQNTELLIREVKNSLQSRLNSWSSFRHYISIRAKTLFAELMRKRGYRGRLVLDHHGRSLELKVQKQDDGGTADGRTASSTSKDKDPRALSGGEKSFSTVCLLLALWESMGSPFRALDEFDVFMDAVNRRVSMKAMIDNAREQDRACQYIFITPQTMGNVPGLGGPDVRVHRLQDPERGQTRIAAGS